MNNKLKLLREGLNNIIFSIDNSNTNITDEQCDELWDIMNKILNPKNKYSKYQSCKYLGMSRAKFDNLVRDGIIPKGRREQGFKEIFWYKSDLDDAKTKILNN